MNTKDTKEKLALIIPCTSNGRDNWENIKDTYLYKLTIKTFLLTKSNDYNYTFYIGYDNNDRIFSIINNQEQINKLTLVFKNVQFKFFEFDSNIKKGHVTKMWNILYKQAYDDENNYFYQCGDDINFKTQNWERDSIISLKNNKDIGISGPLNNNSRILTQVMVSRKHMEIFGWFFPEEIINWCCDDWYNLLYKPNNFFPLNEHYCSNDGGNPRYIINNDKEFNTQKLNSLRNDVNNLVSDHKKILNNYTKF
jgi:hypothetical protein